MSVITRAAAILAALAALSFSASVSADTLELSDLVDRASPQTRLRELDGGVEAAFDALLERYDAEIEAAPFDVVARVDRCRFMEQAASEYEYSTWMERASELASECAAALEADFPAHPEQLLYKLESLYGAERIEMAEALRRDVAQPLWTRGHVARLYTMLAQAMQESNPAVAAGHARYALELDAAADVRLIVAQALIDDRDAAGAVRVLAAPFDPHAADDTYYAVNKMALLAAAGATAEVAALHDALRAGERYYNRSAVIDALLAVKAEDRARAELELFSKNAYGSAGARRLFYFELEHGTTEQALVAYEVLRDHGWAADPLGVLRVSLQVREISLRIRARDFLAIVGFTLAAASIAVACAIPIMLVHYRGLARRARANEPYPVGAWRLRDAWLASFLFSVASLVAGYTVGPFDVNADGSGAWWSGLTDAQMARLNVVGSALALAFLLPVAARGRTADARWWGEQGKVVRGMGLAVAIALLLRVPMLIAFAADSEMVRSAVFELEIWQLLEHIRASFGIGVALWLVVVFAPVVEEFVFRGVLLRAFAAHLNFWAANLFQAVLFAAMHLDPSAFPYLVLVGAAAGWLARRSGGLAAPIALHVVFNLVAALIAFA